MYIGLKKMNEIFSLPKIKEDVRNASSFIFAIVIIQTIISFFELADTKLT